MTRRMFAMTLAAGAAALGAETYKQRGAEIIDRTIKALGGDAFRNMPGRTEIGRASSFYHSQLTGLSPARLYTKYLGRDGGGPLYQLEREVFGKKQEDAVLFMKDGAYEVTYRGAQPIAQDRFEQYRNSTLQDIFYILRIRLGETGLEFEGHGADVVENQPVEILEVYDSEDRNVTVWINSDTYLPAKQRFYRWDPVIKERREEVTHFSLYRPIGNGVMWPWAIERERDTEKIFQLYSQQVKLDDSLGDSLFELPQGIRILKS